MQWASIAIFTVVFLAYALSSSLQLEDYDSINFARAVQSFDVTMDAPHPPGAPLYVAFVKLLNVFIDDIPVALSLSAALGGALFVTVWYKLFAHFLVHRTAAIGTVILAVSPGLWMTASRPMSDTFAAAALSISLLLALRYAQSKDPRNLIYASAMLAISVGIRPQFGLLAPFLFFSTLLYFRSTRKTWVYSIAVFTLINLAWLIPTVISQYNLDGDGWMTYFNQIARFKNNFDTASGSPLLANNVEFVDIVRRAITHIGTLGYFALGLNMWYPSDVAVALESFGTTLNPWDRNKLEWTWSGTFYTAVFVTGCLALIPRIKYHWKKALHVSESVGYLFLVTIAYSVVVVMLVPPHTRFYITLLPLFILLPLVGLQSRRLQHKAQYLLMALAVLSSLQTLVESTGQDAPPIALVHDIRAQSNETGLDTILLLDANAARHASWYLQDAKIYGSGSEHPPADYRKVFKPGHRVFSNYAEAYPEALVHAEPIGVYSRSYRVWMRHTSTKLFELTVRQTPLLAAPAQQQSPSIDPQQQQVSFEAIRVVASSRSVRPSLADIIAP